MVQGVVYQGLAERALVGASLPSSVPGNVRSVPRSALVPLYQFQPRSISQGLRWYRGTSLIRNGNLSRSSTGL